MFWKKKKKDKGLPSLEEQLLPILRGLRKNEANLSAKETGQTKLKKNIVDDIKRLSPYIYPDTLQRMYKVLLLNGYKEKDLPQETSAETPKDDLESPKFTAFKNVYLQSMLYGQDLFSKFFLLEELHAQVMSKENTSKFQSHFEEYITVISESASKDVFKHIFADEEGTFKGYYGVELNDLRRAVYSETCQNKAYSFCLDYDYFLILSADTFNPNNRKPIYLGFRLANPDEFNQKVAEEKENTKYQGLPNIEDAIKSDLIAEDIRQIFSESDSELTLKHIVLDKKMLFSLYQQALSQDLHSNIKTRLRKAIYEKNIVRDGADLSEVFDDITSYFKSKKNIVSDDLDLLYLINPDKCLNFIKQNPKLFESNSLKQHRLVRFKKFFEKGSNLPACISSPEIHGDKNLYAFIKATKEDVNTQDLLQMIKVILDNTKDKLEQASKSKGDIDCVGALEDNALEAIFDEQGQLIDPIFLELVFKNDKLRNKYIENNDPKAMESFSNAAKHVPSGQFATQNFAHGASASPDDKHGNTKSSKTEPGKGLKR